MVPLELNAIEGISNYSAAAFVSSISCVAN
jgi:hypothetical protein